MKAIGSPSATNLQHLPQDAGAAGALLPTIWDRTLQLDNYLALVSGQAPNPVTQADCQSFVDFAATGTTRAGQAIGMGCVYPASVSTIANQLEAKGLS